MKNLYHKIVPFRFRYGFPTFYNTHRHIMKSQFVSEGELYGEQQRSLKLLMEHVYYNIPYYGNLMTKLGVVPSDFNCSHQLKILPILTKQIIRDNYKDLIATNIDQTKLKKFATSGSTGEPLQFVGLDEVYKKEAAFVLRAYKAHGATLYDKPSIWLRRYVPKEGEPFYQYDKELNRLYLSPYHLNNDTFLQYLELMDKSKATTLSAYPSSAYIFALLCERFGITPKHIKYIHLASEKVLADWRNKIQVVFDIAPKAHYGMVEKVSMFFQCEKCDYYHDSLEYGITELIPNGLGSCDVIGTGFLNWAMPFIRYKMNDTAIPIDPTTSTKCTCGRNLPLRVKDFDGRADDILQTKTGYLPPVNFYTMMYKIAGITMFQIVQDSLEHFTVNIVTNGSYLKGNQIRNGLIDRLGYGVKVDIKIVDQIERDPKTQKIRCIVNNVK